MKKLCDIKIVASVFVILIGITLIICGTSLIFTDTNSNIWSNHSSDFSGTIYDISQILLLCIMLITIGSLVLLIGILLLIQSLIIAKEYNKNGYVSFVGTKQTMDEKIDYLDKLKANNQISNECYITLKTRVIDNYIDK